MISDFVKNIRLRLLLLFLIPSLGLLYFAAQNIFGKYLTYEHARRLERSVDYINHASDLIKELQRERGLSILYLASGHETGTFLPQLRRQRQATDRSFQRFNRFLLTHDLRQNESSIKRLLKIYSNLSVHRKEIDQRALTIREILDYYGSVVQALIRSVRKLQPQFEDRELHHKSTDLLHLLSLTELAGQERALVANILASKGKISNALRNYLLNLESDYRKLREGFLQEADLHDTQLYHRFVDPSLIRKIDSSRREIIFARRFDRISAVEWWKLSSRYINALFKVEEGIVNYLQQIKSARKNDAFRTLLISLAIWSLFLLLLTLLFLHIVRIIRNFGSLYERSEEKRRLYHAYSEFTEYLLAEHSRETLIHTLATLLQRSEIFPYLWVASRDKDGIPYPTLAEGIPLARIRQDLESTDSWTKRFRKLLTDVCENNAPLTHTPDGKRANLFEEEVGHFGIFPISYRGECQKLLILALPRQHRFDREEIDLIQKACNVLSQVVEQNERLEKQRKIEEELRIAATAFNAQEAITITNAQGEILKVNDAFTQITGYSPREAIGNNPNILKSGKHDKTFYNEMWDSIRKTGYWKGEIYNRRKNGEIYPEMLSISAVKDSQGRISHYVAHFFDISQMKEAQKTAEYRALHDPLTELYNRQKLLEELERIYRQSLLSGEYNAFLFFDIDNFKHINDYHNHEFGDKVLLEVARRLKNTIYGEDILARIAGDEFALILCCLGSDKNSAINKATLVIEKIRSLFSAPIKIDDTLIELTFSIGVKLFPDGEKEWKDVMINADVAMYHAKRNGKDNYHFFNARLDEESKRFLRMKNDFARALKTGELIVHYQPRLEVQGSRLVGLEALIRWRMPDGKLLMPSDFLFVTQGNTMGYELSEYVLHEVCREITGWRGKNPSFDLRVSINLSAEQFNSANYMKKFLQIVAEKPAEIRQLIEFEIVEDAFVRDLDYTIDIIREFRSLGIEFSIDDFGTGYSSINYLKRLPVESLKIDREFVLDLFEGKNDEIVRLIINTAKIFGMKTVAEGVENERVLKTLRELGCDYYQGFLFSPPVPADTVTEQWLTGG